jgi:hypothetical protein
MNKIERGLKQFSRCDSVYDRAAGARVCFDRANNVFEVGASYTKGVLYKNELVKVVMDDLDSDTMGITYFKPRPFLIVLNRNISPGRMEISLVHELLHVYTEVYKINLSHEQLHTLAVFIDTDIIPAVKYIRK